jgi:hypothetical protein
MKCVVLKKRRQIATMIFPKQETPKKGHAAFCTMSPKRQTIFSGNKKPRFWDIHSRRCTPQKRQTIFFGNKKPRFWDIMRPILAHFGAIVAHGLILLIYVFHFFRP